MITAAQLGALGLSRTSISRWTDGGRLHRIHRGVYAVGRRGLSPHGRWMAAVLACGEGAVLSHTSAAVLWRLLKPFRGPIHVSSPSPNGRSRRSGIVLHRSPSFAADAHPLQVTSRESIPVTVPQRTIDDLRGVVPPYLVRRAIRQAELAGLHLDDATSSQTRGTRSDLELAFLRFCARHAIPAPQVNVKVGRWTVDFLWPKQWVAVETDFFDYHRGSVAFEDDHQRELDLRRRGFTVRRFTGAQIRNHPALVVADLGEVLGGETDPG
ncbi:MAG: type IV toxin-antitoxin system AbiEi family antitoxin domain-containing protein [Thermoleophilia bacterium]|nr:type IV toxin-antitoxin system AbiEi family antitoxin domain-containing protein [Thermoleophilia bacterium]